MKVELEERKKEITIKETRLRDLMVSLGLRGILLKKQANYSWFTAGGVNAVVTSTEMGFSSLLITEKEKFCIASRIEARRNMEEEGLEELGFTLLPYEWYEGDELQCIEKILPPEVIGSDVQMEGMHFIENDIKRLRYSLTDFEIKRYLWLGERTSEAIEMVLQTTKPEDTEAEITGELARLLWKHRIDQVGFQAAADDRVYKYRHPIPTEKKVKRYLMLNVMARKWGLHITVTRFLSFGKISKELKKQYEDNVFIECAMIAMTKPGEVVRDIFVRTKELYEELGYGDEWKLHHQGGAMGYEVRDYICDMRCTETVQENQCFCWNPSISGTKSEDGFIVLKDGFLFLTKPILFPSLRLEVAGVEFVRPNILER